MGVPGFYRWAVRKVPRLRQTTSDPPYEFDNLYLDFNGTVHGCVDEWSVQDTEEVLFALIEAQLALLISIVRPRALLFIALDGVAPRAKMNQQRSRRFRAAKDSEAVAGTVEGLVQKFDRNAITPGTAFMARLSRRLHQWAEAQASDTLRGVTVVISNDRDPGEGEHKIMEVIRHHPERTHCLCSNDADLVFLGLVSNAESVYLLRAKPQNREREAAAAAAAAVDGLSAAASAAASSPATEAVAGDALARQGFAAAFGGAAAGLEAAEAEEEAASGEPAAGEAAAGEAPKDEEPGASPPAAADGCRASAGVAAAARDYELLSIVALRHWLGSQFPDCSAQRVANDFVAMCCLAGNDFLPHIPVVEIYQGGIDRLLRAYHSLEPASQGHLVAEDNSLVLPRWRQLLAHFAQAEVETLLDEQGLGLGGPQPAHRGPGPPTDAWDGLSVLVSHVPHAAKAKDVQAGMSKQTMRVVSVHKVIPPRPKSPTCWIVRFADPYAAVMTLVSTRRIWNSRVTVEWVDPASRELAQPVEQPVEASRELAQPVERPVEAADWRPALERVVRESFEFWLGAENLPKDAFLRRHVRAREDRFVPLRVFALFKRLKVWLQDLRWMAEILRASAKLEVTGEGEEAMVRALQDHSVRPDETPEQVARQQQAMARVTEGDFAGAVLALRHDYYTRHAGPTADGAPPPDDVPGTERHRSRAFLDGVEWVIRYYTRGCSSWSWFYPAHYPPLCASLARHLEEPLQPPPLHAPFPPTLQLLAVLPPQSAPLLPGALRPLLLDQSSPLIDFYPSDFEVDLKEGDREWQATVLLPFVDEARLRAALAALPWSDDSQSEPARSFLASCETAPQAASYTLKPSVGTWLHSSNASGEEKAAASRLGAKDGVASWDFNPRDPLPQGRPGQRPSPAALEAEPPNPKAAGPRKGKGRGKGRRRSSGSDAAAGAAAAPGAPEGSESPEAPEASEPPGASEASPASELPGAVGAQMAGDMPAASQDEEEAAADPAESSKAGREPPRPGDCKWCALM